MGILPGKKPYLSDGILLIIKIKLIRNTKARMRTSFAATVALAAMLAAMSCPAEAISLTEGNGRASLIQPPNKSHVEDDEPNMDDSEPRSNTKVSDIRTRWPGVDP